MKRFFSLLIAVALFGCLPVPASAAGQEKISEMGYVQTAPSTTKHVTADMLLELGYTQEGAENLLEFDRILKKMEAFGQVIDYAEGEFIITPCPMDGLDYVTAAERDHLIRMLTPYVEHAG